MKKLTYILLFIWNIGIGQRDELTDLKIALGGTANNDLAIDTAFIYDGAVSLYLIDSTLTSTINGVTDTSTISVFPIFITTKKHNMDDQYSNESKTEFVSYKAILLISDISEYKPKHDEVIINTTSWCYGYVLFEEKTNVPTPCDGHKDAMCSGWHYEDTKKRIGYLDLSKKPFSKEIIIWDYKIIE